MKSEKEIREAREEYRALWDKELKGLEDGTLDTTIGIGYYCGIYSALDWILDFDKHPFKQSGGMPKELSEVKKQYNGMKGYRRLIEENREKAK